MIKDGGGGVCVVQCTEFLHQNNWFIWRTEVGSPFLLGDRVLCERDSSLLYGVYFTGVINKVVKSPTPQKKLRLILTELTKEGRGIVFKNPFYI